jgi:GNAT superfamily N-acetyltransferase/predicted nuclease with RNAse H fold
VLAAGVDVAEEAKGLDLVVLDADRRVVASVGGLSVGRAAALLAGELRPDVVAIDSPSGWATSGRSRGAERVLARLGYPAFYTPPDPGDHPFYRWVRVGIRLFEALADVYPLYRGGPVEGRAVEVFPHATAGALAAPPPAGPGDDRGPAGRASKGRTAQRRAVLAGAGVPAEALPNRDRVDAALAALTGLLALEGRTLAVGPPAEGPVLLPAGTAHQGLLEVRNVALDSPAAAPLLAGLASEYLARYGENDEMARAGVEDFEPPGGRFVVLLDGRVTVAGGGYRRHGPGVAEVKRMWTHPDHRGRGLAARLLCGLESEAAGAGYRAVVLETGPRQPEAVRLYRSLGYRPAPPFGPYEQALAFTKDLVGAGDLGGAGAGAG